MQENKKKVNGELADPIPVVNVTRQGASFSHLPLKLIMDEIVRHCKK